MRERGASVLRYGPMRPPGDDGRACEPVAATLHVLCSLPGVVNSVDKRPAFVVQVCVELEFLVLV